MLFGTAISGFWFLVVLDAGYSWVFERPNLKKGGDKAYV